jgi:hypothetical protein
MKKLALINTYCNNWERLNLLHNNILKLKELNIDSLVYSPLPLPKEITEIADYTITTKENPVLYMPERGMNQWRVLYNSKVKTTTISPDYGWASVYQYKKLIEFASTLDYDHYFPFIYDLEFDSEIINTFQNPHPKLFFPSPKSQVSKVGNNFLSISKENALKTLPLFDKEIYKKVCTMTIAEKFMEHICEHISGEISEHLTTDKIHEINNVWDFIPETPEINLFINNKDEFKFYFYNIKDQNQEIELLINGQKFNYLIEHHEEYFTPEVGLEESNIVLIKYKNQTFNISKYFQPEYKYQHYTELL